MTNQVAIERQLSHDSVYHSGPLPLGELVDQFGHRQEWDALDEVQPRNLLLQIVRIIDAPDELDLRAAHRGEA